MFLPANSIENPFYDSEIDYLAQPTSFIGANIHRRASRMERSCK